MSYIRRLNEYEPIVGQLLKVLVFLSKALGRKLHILL